MAGTRESLSLSLCLSFFLIHTSRLGKQATMLLLALWKGPCEKELISLANSQLGPKACEEPNELDIGSTCTPALT